ncbi:MULTISPECIES: glycine--tRNA ligase subunit beta [Helicobacter]|uniref:glycine--tRNA ligase subunit beta n=1 Tax=Helicobacter TaxID=209 RepID=UPI00051D665F|nr:glycine--tRNA ligase subunit beta [Helicobacter sp. MIT 03-1616]TLD86435.1 glycine--tRNA ligase subunit beta [Helicobacter sp. MIT 03-1616]
MKEPHLPLLVEIVTEELPALPLLKELPNIIAKWQKSAQNVNITSTPTLYYTPRRITLYEENFPTFTQDTLIEAYGPPLSIAFNNSDKTQGLSKAGESFYKKNNLSLDAPLQTKLKDNKEVLYYAYTKKGVATSTLLNEIITQWLESLHFGKSMLWGNVKQPFIRPVRNICVLLGNEEIAVNAFNITSKAQTFVHRDVSFAPMAVKSAQDYFEILKNGKVILDQNERKEQILKQIADIESTQNIKVEIDEDLLNEIVAITEYPRAAYGSFEKDFLALPPEVIITSMKENQRYFATYANNALHNGFVLVANSTAKDLAPIVQGNQKVLKARLSDAVFFYENDIKNSFKPEKLSQIVFVESLGSMLDKSHRESVIAQILLESFSHKLTLDKNEAKQILKEAITYAKADLLTQMVYEFTELQGIMGYYYAQKFDMHPLVALSIKEQYLPTGEVSPLPSNILSAIVALSIKLDNIFALFSINKIPTGSKDPFALRRAANGVLKIITHYGLDFDLSSDIPHIYQAVGYKQSNLAHIESFFLERLEGFLQINPSLVRCVLNARVDNQKVRNLHTIIENTKSLSTFFEKSNKEALVRLFKRVANILEDDIKLAPINESLLHIEAEKSLYNALIELKKHRFTNTQEHIESLFALKAPLELFFESVLVNDSNPALKTNRQMLILDVYNEFLRIGDIKDITL